MAVLSKIFAVIGGFFRLIKAIVTSKAFRKIRRFLKIFLTGLAVILFFGYFWVTRTSFVKEQLQNAVKDNTTGSLELEVEKVSLFRGVQFKNIILRAGQKFNHQPLLKLEDFHIDYNLPGIFLGDIGIHKVRMAGLHLYAQEGPGGLNWQSLAKAPYRFYNHVKEDADLLKFELIGRALRAERALLGPDEKNYTLLFGQFMAVRSFLEQTPAHDGKEWYSRFNSGLNNYIALCAGRMPNSNLPYSPARIDLVPVVTRGQTALQNRTALRNFLSRIDRAWAKAGNEDLSISFRLAGLYLAMLEKVAANYNEDDYSLEYNVYPTDINFSGGRLDSLKSEFEDLLEIAEKQPPGSEKIPDVYMPTPLLYEDFKADKNTLLVNPAALAENAAHMLAGIRSRLAAGQPKVRPLWDDLLVSFRLLFQLDFSDLNLYFQGADQKQQLQAGVRNFTTRFIMLTKEIEEFPMQADPVFGYGTTDWLADLDRLMGLIDTYIFEVNPNDDFTFFLKTANNSLQVAPDDFKLNLRTYLDGASEKKHLQLKADIGQDKLPVILKGKSIGDRGFKLKYDIQYDPDDDALNIYALQVRVLDKDWINMKGEIQNVRYMNDTSDPSQTTFNLELDKSDISLTDMVAKFNRIRQTGVINSPPLQAGGSISVAPLTIKGTMARLVVDGMVKIDKLFFNTPTLPLSIPKFHMPYKAIVYPYLFMKPGKMASAEDLLQKLRKKDEQTILAQADEGDGEEGFIPEKEARPPDMSSLKAQLRKVEHFSVGPVTSYINGGLLKLDTRLEKDRKFKFEFLLQNFPLHALRLGKKNRLAGHLTVETRMKGNDVFNQQLKFKVASKNMRYTLNYSPSASNNFSLDGKIDIALDRQGERPIAIDVDNISLVHKNYLGRKTIDMKIRSSLEQGIDSRMIMDLEKLNIDFVNLVQSLDARNRESLTPLALDFKKRIKINGSTNFNRNRNGVAVLNHNTYIDTRYKDINAEDLHLFADTVMYPNGNMNLRKVSFTGLKGALELLINGKVARKPGWKDGKRVMKPAHDLRVDFAFGSETPKEFDEGKKIDGWIRARIDYKHPGVKGNFIIDQLNMKWGKSLTVTNVNLDFPIDYNLEFHKVLNLTSGNKEEYLEHGVFIAKPNFTVDRIDTVLPIAGRKVPWTVFKKVEGRPGFQMRMELANNVFEIPQMRMDIFGGVITANDILFNLGRLKKQEWEYKARLQVKDIDLKQLIPKEKRAEIKDGEIRMDLSLVGNRLDKNPIENLKVYMSIYKIGQQFGLMGYRVVKPKASGAANWVIDQGIQNTITIKSFNFKLIDGLVYSTVKYEKGFIGNYVVSPAGESIEQSRIVLSEFLTRVRSQVDKYGSAEESSNVSASQ